MQVFGSGYGSMASEPEGELLVLFWPLFLVFRLAPLHSSKSVMFAMVIFTHLNNEGQQPTYEFVKKILALQLFNITTNFDR
jgi:hypothetical protein